MSGFGGSFTAGGRRHELTISTLQTLSLELDFPSNDDGYEALSFDGLLGISQWNHLRRLRLQPAVAKNVTAMEFLLAHPTLEDLYLEGEISFPPDVPHGSVAAETLGGHSRLPLLPNLRRLSAGFTWITAIILSHPLFHTPPPSPQIPPWCAPGSRYLFQNPKPRSPTPKTRAMRLRVSCGSRAAEHPDASVADG